MTSKVSADNNFLCHVSARIDAKMPVLNDRDDVRAQVCGSLDTISHTDGNYYCILHLPSPEKSNSLFDSAMQSKIEAVDIKFVHIENNVHTSKKSEALAKLIYDFRYVWFPSERNLSKRVFVGKADFSDAVFHKGAFFNSSVFLRQARFVGTIFEDSASFVGVKFTLDADFLLASFSLAQFVSTTFSLTRKANFKLANFEGAAWFDWSTFGIVDLESAKFSDEATFKNVSFSDESRFNETAFSTEKITNFYRAKFAKDVLFDKTKFCNDISFNSVVFGGESDIIFRKAEFKKYVSFKYSTSEGYIRFIDLIQGDECRMNFEEAAFEKASRVSFHTVTLYPHPHPRVAKMPLSYLCSKTTISIYYLLFNNWRFPSKMKAGTRIDAQKCSREAKRNDSDFKKLGIKPEASFLAFSESSSRIHRHLSV